MPMIQFTRRGDSMDHTELPGRLLAVLFPHRCLFCDEVVEYGDFWCGKCGEGGEPPYKKLGGVERDVSHSFAGALAAVEYGGVRKSVWRLKDKGDRRIMQFFAGEMYAMILEHWREIRFDFIVPVPSTASKRRERGFNQAELLARYVSGHTGVPMRRDMLIRREATQVQHGLTAAERRINAAKSYDIGNPEGAAGKTILLVDDVFTTGSTVAACSDKLLAAGARSVYVVTATKTNRQK